MNNAAGEGQLDKESGIFGAIEDLLYEICLLLIFFPYYVFRLLVWPGRTLDGYIADTDAPQSLLSPPLFLLVAAGVAALISPTDSASGYQLLKGVAALFDGNAIYDRLAQQVAPFLLLAVFNALFLEYLTPGGVTRQSFRLPLFANMLIAAPFLLLFAIADRLLTVAIAEKAENFAVGLVALSLAVAAFVYYFRTQILLYRKIADSRWWVAIALAIAAIVLVDVVDELFLLLGGRL